MITCSSIERRNAFFYVLYVLVGKMFWLSWASLSFNNSYLLQTSAVAVSEIIIANITGTTSSSMAVGIKCSDYVPCRNIVLRNITVRTESGQNKSTPEFSCWNAFGFVTNITDPMSCALLPQPTDDGLLSLNRNSGNRIYRLPQGCWPWIVAGIKF